MVGDFGILSKDRGWLALATRALPIQEAEPANYTGDLGLIYSK
jgi:hypothetical protein